MASTLRLTGNAGGNVIISANDTIAADQTFEFPDDGGTLLTTSGETTSNGSGGASGVAQVVGYQQGTWTATVTEGTCDSRNAVWTRIGNRVQVQGRLSTFSETSSVNSLAIPWTALPYPPVEPDAQIAVGSCMVVQINRQSNITTLTTNVASEVRFVATAPNDTSNISAARYTDLGASPSLSFELSYLTANTTWTPSSGTTIS